MHRDCSLLLLVGNKIECRLTVDSLAVHGGIQEKMGRVAVFKMYMVSCVVCLPYTISILYMLGHMGEYRD